MLNFLKILYFMGQLAALAEDMQTKRCLFTTQAKKTFHDYLWKIRQLCAYSLFILIKHLVHLNTWHDHVILFSFHANSAFGISS